MDILFSCRNCIHNPTQSICVGRSDGFCLQHGSVIEAPEDTTCKYLHRKDLAFFVVDEGIREHASEFALFPSLVRLSTREPLERRVYSEIQKWETRTYDPLTHAVSQCHKAEPAWTIIQAFAGGLDGRRSLVHTSLIRRYLQSCGTWVRSYRLVLGLLQDLDTMPLFTSDSVCSEEHAEEALWDVVFSRLAAVQEYGWHGAIEDMMWATDTLSDGLTELDWDKLKPELSLARSNWTREVIAHAQQGGASFGSPREQDG